jgi:hypothetical protein
MSLPIAVMKRRIPFGFQKAAKLGLLVVIILVPLWLVGKVLTKTPQPTTAANQEVAQAEVLAAKASKDIAQVFSFPLRDDAGEELTTFSVELVSAEKRDEILVQGKKATAIAGRTFLILNLKITNNFDSGFSIDTKDYFRLAVNGNTSEWLAPDIHNDPVTVQAISTKLTRIGFPISDEDTQLILRVGEIGGGKQEVILDL